MRFPSMKSAAGALLCGLLLCAALDAAARTTERSKQKANAEQARASIAQQLKTLKKDISRTEDARDDAADELADSEEAISNANRSLHDLADEQAETNARLQNLDGEQQRLAATIDTQKQQLAKLLREHYVAGNEDRIKLLLSGDNPNRINRDLQMMAYVSQAQARLLASLRANLDKVQANRDKAEQAKEDLDEIAQEQRDQKAVLEKEKARRARLLAGLSSKLTAQRKQATNLEKDEQRMSALVDQLSRLIREQAEADRKRQEALAAAKAKADAIEREKALARAKQLAEREQAKPGVKAPKPEEPRVAEQPAKPEPAPRPPVTLAPAAPAGAFASLKGKMGAPITGKVAARFGTKRGEGPSWKGVFIQAPEGTDVHAVAGGRVVFADWMRGFGNLIVVDHGSDYMSIYGNNQTLLKHAGDIVKAGDAIANAGNTGGNEQSGLYFELRYLGKAFDPSGWVRF